MESKNRKKSISLCYLNKNQNINKKIKKEKQKTYKYSLSRKKTIKNNINNIATKKINEKIDSKFLNTTLNPNKNILNLKTNYSQIKFNSQKENKNKPIIRKSNKIYTINIKLEPDTQTYIKINNIQKGFKFKDNMINISKNNNNSNTKKLKDDSENIEKLSFTPVKKINNNKINNSVSKANNQKAFILEIKQSNKREKNSKNKNKISKSVTKKVLYSPNNRIYNNSNNNSINNNTNDAINNHTQIFNNINISKNNAEIQNENKKILVIDLDETLIHTSFQKIENADFQIQLDSNINKKNPDIKNINNIHITKKVEAYIRIRPGVDKFLSQMTNYYDIYVYSASSKNYLNAIIKNIDKNNIIKQCYCRDDCIVYVEDYEEDFDKPNNKYNYVKDLKKINKELRNIVFIDNNTISFKLQEKNGIPIKSWFGDYEDIELYKLIPILKNLSGFYDVRVEISKFVQNKTFIWSKSINWLEENCLNSSYLIEINSILLKEQKKPLFGICNYNVNVMNRPKVINNINNILINLSENNSKLNKSSKFIGDKTNSILKRINTEFDDLNKKFKKHKSKNINVYTNSEINSDKLLFIPNNSKKKNSQNLNKNIKRYFNSNCSQKIQKNILIKKVENDNILENNSLVHQYSLCFSKNDLLDKINLTKSKPVSNKSNINDPKNINKFFFQNHNRVIINYINNKSNYYT